MSHVFQLIHFGWPQGVFVTFAMLSCAIAASKNGEKRDEKYNFSLTFMRWLILGALVAWGGFFG